MIYLPKTLLQIRPEINGFKCSNYVKAVLFKRKPHNICLQNFTSAGRAKVSLNRIPLSEVSVPEPEVKEIKDTLASLRLDSVVSSGFRIGRSLAAQYISAGKAAINGLPCEKPDKAVAEGDKISLRGMGKIKLKTVGGQTKKGRISVVIDRYV